MRIKFIKIEEGKVKAANKALKRKFLAQKGHETEGFKGTYEYAANKQVAKGKDKSTQAGVEAGKVAVGRAALGSAGTGAPRGSNRRARQLAHKERLAQQNSSTEILGDKIVEGIMDWILGGKKYRSPAQSPTDFANKMQKKFIRQSEPALGRAEKEGNQRDIANINYHRKNIHPETFDQRNARINRRSGLDTRQGTGFGRALSKSLFPIKKALGFGGKSRRGLRTNSGAIMSDIPQKYTAESLELFTNKIVESFDRLLNEGGKSSPKRTANREERQAVKKGMFNLGSAQRMATKDPRRNDARARRRSKAAAKAILKLNPGEGARQDAEEVVRRTRS